MDKIAFIVGHTGESGKALVSELLHKNIFKKVVLIGRREVKLDAENDSFEQRIIDFDDIDGCADAFQGCNVGFCCLGTTRGKAGKAGFIKVDHDYIMNVAKMAHTQGCSEFHLVSSQGANANSWILYTKVKGQVDEEVKNVGFSNVMIYRPAMLMCNREESRPAEAIARCLVKPIAWVSPTLLTTPVTKLAQAMLAAAGLPEPDKPSYKIYSNSEIFELSKGETNTNKI